MIIDTTISVIEDTMSKLSKLRCLDEYARNKLRKKQRRHRRESDIRDFLIKQGRNPEEWSNCIVLRTNGEICDVQVLNYLPEEDRAQEEHFQKLIDRFGAFMRFGMSSSRRN